MAWKAEEADHWKEARPAVRLSQTMTLFLEVLVLRARYWHRLPGQYFMDVLEAYLRLNEASWDLRHDKRRRFSLLARAPADGQGHNYTFVMAASFGPDELPSLSSIWTIEECPFES